MSFLLSDYHYVIMISKMVLHIMIYYSYNIATEIYKPGKTDFPALIPQNGAMAELLLSHLPEAAEVQDAVPVS